MDDLLKRRVPLSPGKQKLLDALLLQRRRREAISSTSQPQIAHRKATDPVRLSFAQERLFFLDTLVSDHAAFNIPLVLTLRGPLDLKALVQSVHAIFYRHDILRVAFKEIQGQLFQYTEPMLPLPFCMIDMRLLPPSLKESATLQLTTEQAQKPFHLIKSPLIHVALISLEDEKHILQVTFHHIIFDAWSTNVYIKELFAFYAAACRNTPVQLPDLSIQYTDFVLWQRDCFQRGLFDKQKAYWLSHLAQIPTTLNLPTDHQRPAMQSLRGANCRFSLSLELTRGLKALSQQVGCSLFMTLLAAFQVLLYRYSYQEHFLIGVPIANRSLHDSEYLIGIFINMLAVPADLSGNPSFLMLLQCAQESWLNAYANQDFPFEKLVEEMQLVRDSSRSPLFQVAFALHHASTATFHIEDVSLSLTIGESTVSHFDISLELTEYEQELHGVWEYSTDLFEETTILRMQNHWQFLLENIIAHPERRLDAIPLLPSDEREQLLVTWNQTRLLYNTKKCFNDLFEQQAKETPDAIALVQGEHQISYKALYQITERMALYLRTLGVGSETLVGICAERDIELLMGILSILRAGGAYLPLDPSYPKERLSFLLKDAGVSILCTQKRLLPLFESSEYMMVCLDLLWRTIFVPPVNEKLASPIDGGNLAYVIYTSGSTGTPKGVMVSHHNMLNFFEAMNNQLSQEASGVWLAITSVTFDISVLELLWTLIRGFRVIIWTSQEEETVFSRIQRDQVSHLQCTPSLFKLLLKKDASDALQVLQTVLIGGEVLPASLARELVQKTSAKLYNMYGPTETTVWSTSYILRKIGTTVPIGTPIANTQVYIVDPSFHLTPIGVSGELYIGGDGITRGYLNRPELTAERFLPNPFSQDAGARLYRTGDLAVWRPDGFIEFLGRVDQQIKLKGFRIELGEIETALHFHPRVHQCVVLLHEYDAEDKVLVAYVTFKQGYTLPPDELRAFLLARLPIYMIPEIFQVLDTLPLTSSGKINRRTLPPPERAERGEQELMDVASPRTPVERVLAEICMDVLKLDHVETNSNFFALGGDSMRSLQFISLVRDHGFQISLQQLFQYQTISQLAYELAQQHVQLPTAQERQELMPTVDISDLPDDIEDAYPLSQLQQGMLFHSEEATELPLYQTLHSLRIEAAFDISAWQSTLQLMIETHPVLRTSFDLIHYNVPLQLVHKVVHLPLTIEDLRDRQQEEQQDTLATWLEVEKRQRFDWTSAPLLRVYIHRLTDQTFLFTLSEHHALLDGWSVASLLTQMFQLYTALLAGQRPSSIESQSTTPLKEFVALEQAALQSIETQRFWEVYLAGSRQTQLPRQLELAHRTPLRQTESLHQSVSQHLFEQIKKRAQNAAVPLKSVLLAAHLRVLQIVSGQSDVLTGLVTNCRSEVASNEQALGLFLTTLPYRYKLKGGTWLELINDVFANEQAIQPFRRYPLAQLQTEREGQTLFETVFNFMHFHVLRNLLSLDGLKIEDEYDFAQTDFTLITHCFLDTFSSQLQIVFEYRADVLEYEYVKRIGQYYISILEAMVNQPETRYEVYTPLSQQEYQRILFDWNNFAPDFPYRTCFHHLFKAQADQTPDAIAATDSTHQISYVCLNQLANQFAHYLRLQGIKLGMLIGLYAERNLEWLVAILGILKAGGVYVPLDLAVPSSRLAYILADAQVGLLLTQEHLLTRIPFNQIPSITLDRAWPTIIGQSRDNIGNDISADDMAYIIYTSGSTGKPKGTLLAHRGLCNLAEAQKQIFTTNAQDKIFQFSSASFDASIWEITMALSVGATLCFAKKDTLFPDLTFLRLLEEHAITIITLPPSFLAALSDSKLPLLHTIIAAGEACSSELVRRYAPDHRFFNAYGPTETTVCATVAQCMVQSLTPAIGQPIPNMQAYILDEYLQPSLIGVPGELYLGGVGLAYSYLNQPALTAERFIPHPFSTIASARLYKTGDQACYLADGNIKFLGRIDQQLKIRGFRVEPDEIAMVLNEHPFVQQSVVIASEDADVHKYLVAFVIPEQGATPSAHDLRQFLQERLPSYMVPTVYVVEQSFPLTLSGKIDRQKLKIPEKMRVGKEETYIAPRTQTEQTLLRTWQEVLGITKIGVYDNFFELGGNSLMLIRVESKLKALFGERISIADLLTYPTLATLADFLTEAQRVPAAHRDLTSHTKQRKERMEQQRITRERFRDQR